jgi:ferredoxin
MSEEIKNHPLNAKGKYYVDQDVCTFSENCELVAPEHFKMDEEYAVYVVKQPSTPEEEARCRRAMDECPVAAICDDGNK